MNQWEAQTTGPPATVKLPLKIMNTLQGISTLHMLPNYFTAPTFQHRAEKRQEGSVSAHIPINTWQVWRFQIPFRCSSMNPPTCIPTKISKNIQSIRLASEHSHKHWVKMKAFALLALAKIMLAEHLNDPKLNPGHYHYQKKQISFSYSQMHKNLARYK